jgi:hypothetical protein
MPGKDCRNWRIAKITLNCGTVPLFQEQRNFLAGSPHPIQTFPVSLFPVSNKPV